MQVDHDHVTLLGGGRGPGARAGVRGRRQTGQLPGVPEVAHPADGDQRQDHDQGDEPAAGAPFGLLAALGAVLGEVQPVDDVLGVAVGLLHERELLGVVLLLALTGGSGGVLAALGVRRIVTRAGAEPGPVPRVAVRAGPGPWLGRAGLLRDVGGLLGGPCLFGPGLLPGGGLPVGVVGGLRSGAVRVVGGGRLGSGVVRVVGGRLPAARAVRVVAVPLLPVVLVLALAVALALLPRVLLLPVRVVGLLGGLLGRDLPVDGLAVLVVADEFVLVAPVPRVVSVVHRYPSRLTRRGTARACRCSARRRPAPGTRRGRPWRLSRGSRWRRWRARAPRRARRRLRAGRGP